MVTYVSAYCRIIVGLAFLASSLPKAYGLPTFEQTIKSFRLVPDAWSWLVARFLLLGEFLVAAVTLAGTRFWWLGLLLAIIFLSAFSVAIASTLRRNIRTRCNCFGPSTGPLSLYDVWRNVGFVICALVGISILFMSPNQQERLDFQSWGLVGVAAAISLAIWLNLQDIVRLLRQG